MPRWTLSQRLIAFVTIPAVVLLVFGWFRAGEPAQFFKEGGAVETVSVLLLVQGAICWFAVHGRAGWRDWQIPAVLLLFAMREMDFDKRFTDSGLLKLRTYTGDAPLMLKLAGAAAILFSLWVIWRILVRNGPGWWRGLRAGRFPAVAVLLAMAMVVFAKALDGLGRKLLDVGIVLSDGLDRHAGRVEEVLELAAWWLLALAIARLPAARAHDHPKGGQNPARLPRLA